jgi:hypothetical protein
MNTHRTSSTAPAAVIAMILAVPGITWAGEGGDDDHGQGWNKGGDDDHDHGWNKGGYKSNEHYNIHENNRYYGHYAARGPYYPRYAGRGPYYPHYAGQGPYYPQYHPSYPCSTCGKNSHHNNNNNNGNDKLWIGLLGGGILGYGVGTYMHSNTADQGSNPEATNAPPPPTQYANTAPDNTCLQQREYNTKIMVGGKQVNGYGTACLQPDGSWRYGAAQPESY